MPLFFFTLIPKVPNPVDLKECMPSSLVGRVYKLLVKILANRMKVVLPWGGCFVQRPIQLG